MKKRGKNLVRGIIIFFILALLPFVAGQGTTVSISGTVTDASGPIEGAHIIESVGFVDDFTDSSGAYSLDNLAGGLTYDVEVSADGYVSQVKVVVLGQQSKVVDFTLVALSQDEICNDGIDNDGDGAVDQCDTFCGIVDTNVKGNSVETGTERTCTDGIDNDCDGTVDCSDSDCSTNSVCVPVTGCGNNLREGTEECDGSDKAFCGSGKSCQNDCTCPLECGNNLRQGNEQCDGTDNSQCPGNCIAPGQQNACSCPIEQPVCGNGLWETGEQCDCGDDITCESSQIACPSADASCFPAGSAKACQCVTTSTCGNGEIELFEECDAVYDELGNILEDTNDICPGNCIRPGELNACSCPKSCSNEPGAPSVASLSGAKGELALSLHWSLDQEVCAAEYFSVTRCEGDFGDCGQDDATFRVVASGLRNLDYTDFTIDAGKDYCYKVGAYYENSVLVAQTTFSELTAPSCMYSGDTECFNHLQEHCEGDVRFSCDQNNAKTEVANGDCGAQGLTCVGPFAEPSSLRGKTECRYQSQCELCGDPFGMFFQNARVAFGNDQNFQLCSSVPTCFKDYSDTTVDKYYQCALINSCYDYRSQSACESDVDHCSVGGTALCAWEETQYTEVGIGTCRPVAVDEQDCSRCANPYNELFGECDQSICSAHGACFFNGAQCINEAAVGCQDYTTQLDCGSTSAVIDVSYGGNTRTRGTHAVVTESNDKFGFGVCAWTGTACFKDGDGDGRADHTWCNSGDRRCFSDNVTPVTILNPVKVSPKKLILPFTVVDNGADEGVRTYFGVGKNFVYPTTRVPLVSGSGVFSHDFATTGSYVVSYYSIDQSQNLEKVKSFEVFVDAVRPVVSTTVAISPMAGSDPVASVLDINVAVSDNIATKVQCSGDLRRGKPTGEIVEPRGQFLSGQSTMYNLRYSGLQDGEFFLVIDCSDHYGNSRHVEERILVDSDTSITALLPSGTIAQNSVTLSLTTEHAASCRYSQDNVAFGAMVDVFNTNDLLRHFKQLGSIAIGNRPSRRFYVKCQLQSSTLSDPKIVGNSADVIVFTVDVEGPRTNFTSFPPLSPGEYSQGDVAVSFACEDLPRTGSGFPPAFGCADTKYCFGQDCTPTSIWDGGTLTLEQSTVLRYRSFDTSGKAGEVGTKLVLIDRIAPEFTVYIEDPVDNYNHVNYLNRPKPGYRLRVESTKPLRSSGLEASFEIGDEVVVIDNFGSLEGSSTVWTAPLSIVNLGEVFDETFFSVRAVDTHGIIGTVTKNDVTFTIDTRAVESPILDPPLARYVNNVGDVFYTTFRSVVVPGFTTRSGLLVHYFVARSRDALQRLKIANYAFQELQDSVIGTATTSGQAVQGSSEVTFVRTDMLLVGNYLRFPLHDRRYPFYNEFYKVISVTQGGSVTGGATTKVLIDPPLENRVGPVSVEIHSLEMPSNRFRETIDFASGTNFMKLRGQVNAFFKSSFTPVFNLFEDHTAPEVLEKSTPKNGTTINSGLVTIDLFVRELKAGSGLNSTFQLFLDNRKFSDPLARNDDGDNQDYALYRIRAIELVTEGEHTISFTGSDIAGNEVRKNTTFFYRPNAPDQPTVGIDNSILHNGVLFIKNPAGFNVTFKHSVENVVLHPDYSAAGLNSGNNVVFVGDLQHSLEDGAYELSGSATRVGQAVQALWRQMFIIDRTSPTFVLEFSDSAREHSTVPIDLINLIETNDVHGWITIGSYEGRDGIVTSRTEQLPRVADDAMRYDLAIGGAVDGTQIHFNLTVEDIVGNFRIDSGFITIDNTDPNIIIEQVLADDVVLIGEGETAVYRVRDTDKSVTILGRITEVSDLTYIHSDSVGPVLLDGFEFSLPLTLDGRSGEEEDNTVIFQGLDKAGNSFERVFALWLDLKGPSSPEVTFEHLDEDGRVTEPFVSAIVRYNEPVSPNEQGSVIASLETSKPNIRLTVEILNSTSFRVQSREELGNGKYVLKIVALDDLNNVQSPPAEVPFTVEAKDTDILLRKPRHGFSSQLVFDVEVETSRLATCEYVQGDPLTTNTGFSTFDTLPNSRVHRKDGFAGLAVDHPRDDFGVSCIDSNDNSRIKTFELVYDGINPTITSVSATPEVINELINSELFTTVRVVTTEDTVCRYSNASVLWGDMVEFDRGNPFELLHFGQVHTQKVLAQTADIHDETLFVRCEDIAGRRSGVQNVTFGIRSEELVLSIFSPPTVVTREDVLLNISTNKNARCSFFLDGGAQQDFPDLSNGQKPHFAVVNGLTSGPHSVLFDCFSRGGTFGQGINVTKVTHTFTVDLDNPIMTGITLPNATCDNGQGDFSFTPTFSATDNSSSIVGYNYSLFESPGGKIVLESQFTTSHQPAISARLNTSMNYKLAVLAIDQGGRQSTILDSSVFEAHAKNSAVCKENDPPTTSLVIVRKTGGADITINCKDKSGCDADSFEYGLSVSSSCILDEKYNGTFFLETPHTMCWKVCDTLGNCVTNQQPVDPRVPDADGDGIADSEDDCPATVFGAEVDASGCEVTVDSDGDGIPDAIEDRNGNGIVDIGETDPNNPDSDGDGLSDGEEDSNHNGVVDPGETDPTNPDMDNDGLLDGEELEIGTDPFNPDSDGDGIPDGWEVDNGLDPLDGSDADLDGDDDGLTNIQEYRDVKRKYGRSSDPNNPDTDGDGLTDGEEFSAGSSPIDADDPIPRTAGGGFAEESGVLPLILILLGLLLIAGGVMYLVYKKTKKPKGRLVDLPEVSETVARPVIDFEAQRRRLDMLRKRLRSKEKERKNLLTAFETEKAPLSPTLVKKVAKQMKMQPKVESEKTVKVETDTKTVFADDIFSRLSRVGKKDKDIYDKLEKYVRYKPVNVHDITSTSSSDVFAHLSSLSKGKDPFDELGKEITKSRGEQADEVVSTLGGIARRSTVTPDHVVEQLLNKARSSVDIRVTCEHVLRRLVKEKILSRDDALLVLRRLRRQGVITREDVSEVLYTL